MADDWRRNAPVPSAHAECVRKGEFRAFVGTVPYSRRSFTTREEAMLWCEGWNACIAQIKLSSALEPRDG